MNFDHVNQVSDYCRNQILPHLTSRINVNDFGNYLGKISEVQSCRWMRQELRAFPINYFVNPVAFTKKYAKKCVAFTGTGNPQEGALNIIYQISPSFHVLARLYHWVEHSEVRAYLMLTCAYRDHDDYLAFFDENRSLRLVGNTEERMAGFNPNLHTSPDIGNLPKFGCAIAEDDDDGNDGLDLNR